MATAKATSRGQPLTPAETRVAQLHLGRIYKKLGLRSRTELALRLARTNRKEQK